jgi:hypothetical protein
MSGARERRCSLQAAASIFCVPILSVHGADKRKHFDVCQFFGELLSRVRVLSFLSLRFFKTRGVQKFTDIKKVRLDANADDNKLLMLQRCREKMHVIIVDSFVSSEYWDYLRFESNFCVCD